MSGTIEEDIIMGSSPNPGAGNGIYVNGEMFERLIAALSTKSTQSFKVREPDVFRGERSAIAVTSWVSSLERRSSTTLPSLHIHWVIPRLVDEGVV